MNAARRTFSCSPTAGAAALLLLGACGTGDDSPSAAGSNAADLHVIERGPMRISVREAAELKAARENRIKSEVEGQATIIFLVPEGSVVEEGEKVVELDVSDVEERRAGQAIDVERAYATLTNARQNMEILEKELEAELAEASSRLEIAQIDLEKFLGTTSKSDTPDGDVIPDAALATEPATDDATAQALSQGANRDVLDSLERLVADRPDYTELPGRFVGLLGNTPEEQQAVLDRDMGELGQQVLEKVVEIRNAGAQLKLDEDNYGHSERLAQKDYITRNQLAGDKLKYESQASRVLLAWQQLDILIGYSLRKEQIDLELKYNNASIGLEKVKASNNARREREKAELLSREAEYLLAKERLENFDRQIANAVIVAPGPGLVVYAEGDGRGREMIQEGMTVRERQTLIVLPDVTRMMAEMKIQEADIDKVRVGQPASIQVDAFPDKVLTGRVSRVSPVADSGSRWSNNNLKVYKTWVDIDGINEEGGLRPNMSASVEILVGEVPDTLTVPVSAVRRQGAVKYIWKALREGPSATEVKIGRNTLTHVEILEGVQEGDQVYLAPPPGILAPQFEQPQTIDEVRELERGGDSTPPATEGSTPPATGADPRGPRGDQPPGGAMSGEMAAAMEEYQAAVIRKFPQFKEVIEAEGMRALMRNQEIRDAVSNDAELQEMRQSLFPRGGGRRGGNGEGGAPGGTRGDGGGGFGGRRQGGPDGQNGGGRGN